MKIMILMLFVYFIFNLVRSRGYIIFRIRIHIVLHSSQVERSELLEAHFVEEKKSFNLFTSEEDLSTIKDD